MCAHPSTVHQGNRARQREMCNRVDGAPPSCWCAVVANEQGEEEEEAHVEGQTQTSSNQTNSPTPTARRQRRPRDELDLL